MDREWQLGGLAKPFNRLPGAVATERGASRSDKNMKSAWGCLSYFAVSGCSVALSRIRNSSPNRETW
jgi:hypothetical protein